MPWVRTKINPAEDLWVTETQHADLAAKGLLMSQGGVMPPDPDDGRFAGLVADPTSRTSLELRAASESLVSEQIGDKTKPIGLAARAALMVRTLLSSASAFLAAVRLHATLTIVICGIDPVDGRIFGKDVTNGQLKQSADWGANWSISKTLPANVTAANIIKILRFKGDLYLLAGATDTGLPGVYRATPQAGNTAFSWSGPLFTLPADASALSTCFSADDTHMLLAEYGDPAGGPRMHRTADGTTWGIVFGPDATLRHMHAVTPDPENPGHWWAAAGDGTAKSVMRSTSNGAAGSWQVVVASSVWQAVQISFDEDWVWLAGDSQRATAVVVDRDTGAAYSASTNHHKHIAVPGGAAGDLYFANAYFGAVDPATGIYYCVANDTSAPGTNMGMFYLAAPGGRMELLDAGGKGISMNQEVFIGGGYVFSGQWRHSLLAAA